MQRTIVRGLIQRGRRLNAYNPGVTVTQTFPLSSFLHRSTSLVDSCNTAFNSVTSVKNRRCVIRHTPKGSPGSAKHTNEPQQSAVLAHASSRPPDSGPHASSERIACFRGGAAAFAAGSAKKRAKRERRMIVGTVVSARCCFAISSAEHFLYTFTESHSSCLKTCYCNCVTVIGSQVMRNAKPQTPIYVECVLHLPIPVKRIAGSCFDASCESMHLF